MTRIFLAPRSNETSYNHFLSTLTNGVDYNILQEHLSEEGKAILKNRKIFVRGNKESLKPRRDLMQEGDYVMFYVKGIFKYVGRVIYKQFSRELSAALRPTVNNQPWSCLFFLDDIKEIGIPISEINRVGNYKLRVVQGFMPMNEIGNKNIINDYGTFENFFGHKFTEVEEVIKQDNKKGSTESLNYSNIFDKIETIENENYQDKQKAENITISDIIKAVDRDWFLPDFQRHYVRTKSDVKDLLESIFHEYYIGNLLLRQIPRGEQQLGIIKVEGSHGDVQNANYIILDGQQRITSIYYAFKAPNYPLKGGTKPTYFYLNIFRYFDELVNQHNIFDGIIVADNKKLTNQECFIGGLLPLWELENYDERLDEFSDFLDSKGYEYNKVKMLRKKLSAKCKMVLDKYNISYILLPATASIDLITEIFEKINSTGIKLSIFDLMIAKLHKYNIKLRELWQQTRDTYPLIDKYYSTYKIEQIPIHILRSISIYYHSASSAKSRDLLNIYHTLELSGIDFEDARKDFSKHMSASIEKLENLRDGYGVKTANEIPFIPQIALLTSLLKLRDKEGENMLFNEKLDIIYRSGVFANAYSFGVEGQLTEDFTDFKKWLYNDEDIPRVVEEARRLLPTLQLHKFVNQGSAIYKGVMALIGLEGAKDFETGSTFEMAYQNNKDHLFPKSQFKNTKYASINSVLNMTWMSEQTNKWIKKGKLPSFIYSTLVNNYGEERVISMMNSHLINTKALFAFKSDNFDGFIEEREKIVLDKIAKMLGLKNYIEKPLTAIRPETPFDNKRAYRGLISSSENYIHILDKYFSLPGLEMLADSVESNKVKSIKVLTSSLRADSDFRKYCKDLKVQFEFKGVDFQLRILTDKDVLKDIHDRYLITKNKTYNIPSPDIVKRNQLSDITEISGTIQFDEIWSKGLDIIVDWNEIMKTISRQ